MLLKSKSLESSEKLASHWYVSELIAPS